MRSSVLERCTIIRAQSWAIPDSAPVAAEQALALQWPMRIGTVAVGRANVACVGPTDWLVIAPAERESAALLKALTEAFAGSSFRATDVSSALVRIHLEGDQVRTLLSQGCGIDFHPQRFPPGLATRTRFAGLAVVLWCTGTTSFECIVARSYEDYLLAWLADAGGDRPSGVALQD